VVRRAFPRKRTAAVTLATASVTPKKTRRKRRSERQAPLGMKSNRWLVCAGVVQFGGQLLPTHQRYLKFGSRLALIHSGTDGFVDRSLIWLIE
jgi:hypothetical protein